MNTRFGWVMLAAAVAAIAAIGCGKNANEGSRTALDERPNPDGGVLPCGPDRALRWQFIQPEPRVSRSVDVLFVVDTSNSILAERGKIARDFPHFVEHLPDGTDYRVAVMEGHGGSSPWSGKLYSTHGAPPVLSSTDYSLDELQKHLSKRLCDAAVDPDIAHGEAPFHSFSRSLESENLSAIQSQGFYREDAALSVIFVSDENDVCFPPQLHGYKKFPDYVHNLDGSEMKAYNKYCVNPDGTERVTPESILAGIRGLKGGMPFSVGAVIHQDAKKVPIIGQDSIGHGYLELLALAGEGLARALEITSAHYAAGLSDLASLSHLISQLQSTFNLSSQPDFDPATLSVEVDGKSVPFHFVPGALSVEIRGGNLGHANSVVEVRACRPNSG